MSRSFSTWLTIPTGTQATRAHVREAAPIIAVRIVSATFTGLNRVDRHRLVYGLLPAEFADGLHALALDAKAPGSRDGRIPGSFGPYACALAPAEAETAAARLGLRVALRGGLLASHLAPLAAFTLVMLFATILALTGFISRRAGEATLLLAAAAFMIQRLVDPLAYPPGPQGRMGGDGEPRARGRADGDARRRRRDARGRRPSRLRLDYADRDEAEDAGA